MKNVTVSLVNKPSGFENGEKSRVALFVLFGCACFLVVQLFFAYSSSKQVRNELFSLTVTPSFSLDFLAATSGMRKFDIPVTLTPFFFKAIPVNSCNKDLLLTVSGIGPTLADSILNKRKEIGGFRDKNDLLLVSGIGESRMERFSASFSFRPSFSE